MNRFIVAGIHTDVGKTVVAAILTEALAAHYWKPVQCGHPRDTEWVQQRLSLPNRALPEKYCFGSACSPHLAARHENIHIDLHELQPPICPTTLIIEGAGGILAPLNESESWADAAASWNARWILVHRHYIGSLNHFLLTVAAIQQRELPLAGVIFNGEGDPETEQMLLRKAHAQCLGRLTWHSVLSATHIQTIAQEWKPQLLQMLGS